MQDVKQCPFCASNSLDIEVYTANTNDKHKEYMVTCMNCGCAGPNELSIKSAKEMWNMRRLEILPTSVAGDGAYWTCAKCGASQYKDFDFCGDCQTPRA